ncbi:MAG: hypothetical protein JSU65_12125, partial [Candidatus Zixiibacteriota bacterium]
MVRSGLTLFLIVMAVLIIAPSVHARTSAEYPRSTGNSIATAVPAYCIGKHDVGNLIFGVSNNGSFGTPFSSSGDLDCFTGERVPTMEYPAGSNSRYLFGAAFWIGGIIETDTLVSSGRDGWSGGAELHPHESPAGDMISRSTVDPTRLEAVGAVSEQDYVAVYTDTFTSGVTGLTLDFLDGRPHLPLNIEITQETYAWSYPHTDDFVIFSYQIKNIGTSAISDGYLGVYVDGDVHSEVIPTGFFDDVAGFIPTARDPYLPVTCGVAYPMNLAWIADNDGDLYYPFSQWSPHVTGTRVLQSPVDSPVVSFNWWVSNGNPSLDWGPMRRDNYRDFGTGGMGTPEGDRNKYYMLSNGEIDFDQIYTGSVFSDDSVWYSPPPTIAADITDGWDTKYLLSFGPFDLGPGESVPLALAYVAGKFLHKNLGVTDFLPEEPEVYYMFLDFSDLTYNAMWAGYVYDNPGVDTDSDGYAGQYVVCNGDTVWTEGDGVPDYRAVVAPPAPHLWVEPLPSALRLRWNGHLSETSRDIISREINFEGYNIYYSPEPGTGPSTLVASCDVQDYYKYVWNPTSVQWDLVRRRFTVEELRCKYAAAGCGDSSFIPEAYYREDPYRMPYFDDSVFYFEPIGCNAALFGWETPIVKSYPEATEPPYSDPSEVPLDSIDFYLT